jgi:hypothetical protein
VILVRYEHLFGLVTDDRNWAAWSQQQLDHAAAREELAINGIALIAPN